LTLEDGSEKDVQLYAQVVDYQSGNVVTLNDIRGRYECYTDVGPSFQSMKEQNRAEIQELLTKVPQGTPEFQMLMLQYFTLLDGKGVEMMREYANKQLVMMGLKKPETPEEMEMVQQAQQQPQQPSAEQIQAQGILLQGQAELLKAENQQAQIQVEAAKVEAQNQLNAAKIAEIFNNMDLDKQAELREYLRLVGQFQQQRSKDARANAELLLKDADQTHSQRMDFANLMRQVQIPSGGVAETPQ
ncbi:TPA: portal protein, partial [Shigella flexneri]|nr:portal protein [Shigella flexneri]